MGKKAISSYTNEGERMINETPMWLQLIDRFLPLLLAIVAGIPGVIALIVQRRKDAAEAKLKEATAKKTDTEGDVQLSEQTLAWTKEFRDEMKDVRVRMGEVTKELNVTRAELNSAKSEALSSRSELLKARQELVTVQQENMELKSKLSGFDDQLAALRSENVQLRAQVKALQDENVQLTTQLQQLNQTANGNGATPC